MEQVGARVDGRVQEAVLPGRVLGVGVEVAAATAAHQHGAHGHVGRPAQEVTVHKTLVVECHVQVTVLKAAVGYGLDSQLAPVRARGSDIGAVWGAIVPNRLDAMLAGRTRVRWLDLVAERDRGQRTREVGVRVYGRVQVCVGCERHGGAIGIDVAVVATADNDRIDADVGPPVEGLPTQRVEAIDRDVELAVAVGAIRDWIYAQFVPGRACGRKTAATWAARLPHRLHATRTGQAGVLRRSLVAEGDGFDG